MLVAALAVVVGELSDNVRGRRRDYRARRPGAGLGTRPPTPDLTTLMVVVTTVVAPRSSPRSRPSRRRPRLAPPLVRRPAGGGHHLGAGLLIVVLKQLVGRSAPRIDQLVLETNQSFPSGHALASAAVLGCSPSC